MAGRVKCSKCLKTAVLVCFCKELPFCQTCIGGHLAEGGDLPHQTVVLSSKDMMEVMKAGASQINQARAQIIQEQQEVLRRKTFALDRLAKETEAISAFENHTLDLVESKVAALVSTLLQTRKALGAQVRELCLRLRTQLDEIKLGLNQSAGTEALEILKTYPALETVEKPLFRLNAEYREMNIEKIVRDSFAFDIDWMTVSKENDLLKVLDCEAGLMLTVDCLGLRTVRRDTISGFQPTYQPSICLLPRGEFLVTGGGIKSQGSLVGALETATVITEALGSTLLPVMNNQRMGHASIYQGGNAYVMGGWPVSYLCERFSFSDQNWQRISNLKQGRSYPGICEFEGKIYVAGGHEVDSIEMYLPSQDIFMPLGIRLPATGRCGLVTTAECILAFHGDNISQLQPLKSICTRERGVNWRADAWLQHPILPAKDSLLIFVSNRLWRYRVADKDLETASDTAV